MLADAQPRPFGRLAAWLKGDEPAAAAPSRTLARPDVADVRRTIDRDTLARIVAFLHDHDLAPSEEHLLVARRYVTGDDRQLCEAIDARLRADRSVSAAFLDQLIAAPAIDRLRPEALAEFADMLAASLAESCRTISRSRDSARDYGAALDSEARAAAADPGATIERLMVLTAAAVDRSQQLATQLEETQRETAKLRNRLETARRDAERDHLTGLPNRRSFDARVQAQPSGTALRHIALCDIDDFKRVNDQHGHDAGDRVLKLFGRQLKTRLGTKVLVARHGGEEFACLFEGCSLIAARGALDAVREELGRRNLVNQTTGTAIGRVTFSAGIATIVDSPRAAMRAADAALYAAKDAGKDRVLVAATEQSP